MEAPHFMKQIPSMACPNALLKITRPKGLHADTFLALLGGSWVGISRVLSE